MLKILSRVMYPYAGSVEMSRPGGCAHRGGLGHPPGSDGPRELYLYGSLLGLSSIETSPRRFDEIVEFAELEIGHRSPGEVLFERHADAPRLRGGGVSRARLLLVDEVLAVGDARFQQRCLNRMSEVLQLGTTLIYVSHDLATVESMCRESIWLNQGVVEARGTTADVLSSYRQWVEQLAEADQPEGPLQVREARCANPEGESARTGEPLDIRITVDSDLVSSATINLGISLGPGWPLLFWNEPVRGGVGGESDTSGHRIPPAPSGPLLRLVLDGR